ncbi:type II toxin-antitoxin system HipA family toxin [Candidatus Paracaedibacter symbiosus]|uniref:type II toxin-antitoxin system HipA family toxin n=1 Tax=Candidatus Paracaedibacter symbiosus TaxID=244582 RepID=UPI000509A888|nr:HipA domain-containing protein [Candidatus Paracaedibacter symbiosus]
MANLLWGKVYYKDIFAGILREEPGDRTSFEYDPTYLNTGNPVISYTMPIESMIHISQAGLHPFFDNLVAEGWLEHAQSRLLNKRHVSRFELLLAFGYDCAGAVSIADPEPARLTKQLLDMSDSKEMAVLTSRASLSGIQPKLAVVAREGKYYPATVGELSTHIAKFPSSGHADLTINEYLTSIAFKALLPDDDVVDLSIEAIEGITEPALITKRFDRTLEGRIHFEEFNQLLNRKSSSKYDGSHKEMSDFIRTVKDCLPIENYRLYARILAGLLLGNTDMHFKNFAMFHTPAGLRLTPSYDQVSAVLYQYKTIALAIGGASNMQIGNLKPKNLITMADEFALPRAAVSMLFKQLSRNKSDAKDAILSSSIGHNNIKDQLIKLMDARWNGTFALIGQTLSMKQ